MKFLLVPNFNSRHDIKLLKNLAHSICSTGHHCEVSLMPLLPNKNFPNDKNNIADKYNKNEKEIYCDLNVDVLLEINRTRSNYLNKKAVHINWIQDLPLNQIKEIKQKRDKCIVYTYGSPTFFGLSNLIGTQIKTLLAGYNCLINHNQEERNNKKQYDINLLGYMSDIWEICREEDGFFPSTYSSPANPNIYYLILKEVLRRPRILLQMLKKDLTLNPRPFFDSTDFKKLLQKIRANYKPLTGFLDYQIQAPKKFIQKCLWNYLFVEYPRYKDRLILFNELNKLPLNITKIVAGPNWKNYYPEYPFVFESKDETEVFSRSKVTVHNNTHGLGLHPRVLECIACGSFPLMHGTPYCGKEGTLEAIFEPNRHFGAYNKENFKDVALFWIQNDAKRQSGVQEAQRLLMASHSWDVRAKQILHDIETI